MFEKAGRHDLARGMGEEIQRQVEDLIEDAADKRAQGDLRAAIDTLNGALRKAPGNLKLLRLHLAIAREGVRWIIGGLLYPIPQLRLMHAQVS